jgi:glycogen synthase
MAGTIVFVSFENEFAPVGGLAAVMKFLPPEVARLHDTILLTPCFQNIIQTRRALESGQIVGTGLVGRVLHGGRFHDIQVMKAALPGQPDGYRMYLVKSDTFFLGGEDPYIDTWRYDSLFNDSCFLCKSVPVVLDLLKDDVQAPFMVGLQDWETALVADSMQYLPESRLFLTLHNIYDTELRGDPSGRTVLQYTIQMMQGLSTVSEQYAVELTTDVLQRDCLAAKLQGLLADKGITGINNGNFVALNLGEDQLTDGGIMAIKQEARASFSEILLEQQAIEPTWGNKIDIASDDRPVFLVFGRDDPKQKGFDVAAAAVYRLLQRSGKEVAYFIFAPIPGAHGLDGIAYLEDLCAEFGDNVMVFAARLSAGYQELQKAASYIIMPSYYEPWGAANEGYASGVPVIARATGGLIQQVCPVNASNLPPEIAAACRRYHGEALAKPTGFLYREHSSTETADNWRYILGIDFSKRRPIEEPVNKLNPVFWSMVDELVTVLKRAIAYYNTNKVGYSTLVINGVELFKEFSWEKSAKAYLQDLFRISID